ncbi:MAG TPA: prepilin-type N-terminal cleavage/methylation domain-containing protein [Gemmataceae bacterium]|nr:prepilin-type N-terminal cleavage/methylation domain-containing protein [Gemmataceae bacterium]
MCATKKTVNRRHAFTLIEMLVVIGIILVIAALAAAFAPRVSDSQNLTRAVDNLEQWLLTAKMRAKRDQLATGIRLVQLPGDAAGNFSQVQYIQQPDPLSGAPGGGFIQSAGGGTVMFGNVDFTMGGNALLVQPGDYLEVRGGGVYQIGNVTGPSSLQLSNPTPGSYDSNLTITTATTNYRILRQGRILIGEAPVNLPNNFAIDFNVIPGTSVAGSNAVANPSGTAIDILFSPTGAVVGTNAGSGKVYLYVHDITQADPNIAGIVGIQCRTGFIGAYSVAPGGDPFAFAESGRESGL